MNEVTRILHAIDQGDPQAADQLFALVYQDLRKLAAAKLAHEKPGHTFVPTELVHEAYLRLVGDPHFANRRHFFAAAAEAMRRILVDHARRKGRQKRGGPRQRIDTPLDDLPALTPDTRLIDLDEALERLTHGHPEKAELVKLHFFTGLTLADAAAMLGIDPSTADRWWKYARAWLQVELSRENPVSK